MQHPPNFEQQSLRQNPLVESLFLQETVLSEHTQHGQSLQLQGLTLSQTCSVLQSRALSLIENPTLRDSTENIGEPDRFLIYEIIESLFEEDEVLDIIETTPKFFRIYQAVELFLRERNPHLLRVIKKPGTFREKIWNLNFLLEYYSFETAEHTEEVGLISEKLARRINKDYGTHIDLVNFKDFGKFHDLGKLLIPSSVLLKPGQLTTEEFDIIKRHPIYSSILIKIFLYNSTDKDSPETRAFADMLIKTALYHHRTNTGGYPIEVSQANVSLESEIVRISDIFQAISSQRCYKSRFDPARVQEILEELAPTFKFPEVFQTFLKYKERWESIMEERLQHPTIFELVHFESIDQGHADIEAQLITVLSTLNQEELLSEYIILVNLIEQHFREEEAIMDELKFPFADRHKSAHKELLSRTKEILNYPRQDIDTEFVKKFVNVWFRKTYYFHSKNYDLFFTNWIASEISTN